MGKEEYKEVIKKLDELKDIEDWDSRCDEFNELLDKAVSYENENNIYVSRAV
jgi:hypothetical protein